jgi:hypothetical protein
MKYAAVYFLALQNSVLQRDFQFVRRQNIGTAAGNMRVLAL